MMKMDISTNFFKKYIKEKIRRVSEKAKLRYESIVVSTNLARENMERRLEGMNEFRQALKDSNDSFITRQEWQIQITKMEEDIRMLREAKANTEGKASMTSVYVSYIIAAIALIISIIRIFI